ncbi:hypothetical protein EV1_004594 [Malus domestica]
MCPPSHPPFSSSAPSALTASQEVAKVLAAAPLPVIDSASSTVTNSESEDNPSSPRPNPEFPVHSPFFAITNSCPIPSSSSSQNPTPLPPPPPPLTHRHHSLFPDTHPYHQAFSPSPKTQPHLSSSTRSISLRNENPVPNSPQIYNTTRAFRRPSKYEFHIRDAGTHMVRLHFQTFNSLKMDWNDAQLE